MTTATKMLNVRLPVSTYSRLSELTNSTGRSKTFLAVEALDAYLEQQAWQIAEIKAGLAEADRGEFATEEEVRNVFAKYGA